MMLPRTLLLATGLSLVSLTALADALNIEDAQVRAVPPGSETSAAFMTLHNTSDTDIALVDTSSPAAEVMELHNHEDVDGVMQMRKVSRIIVPAGETVALAPGGLHMMLIKLTSPLVEGEPVELTLTFDNGESQVVEAPVSRINLDAEDHGHDHGHGHKH
ncbi:copper chaperone PCu(A)C [Halomonas sp. ANAO-440]|uniref:copper chaperone PCu(A)C n=1 Tax=Halomonas sp. ANAO-440 TaxID=2861360 RepID=UPI001CAA53CA|nr:copper chaperone PCu(A)C [Halomonas sp. ANAO-440]MBZ0328706.1 copper chaperone PCu(A)C [Halomonas sp. ANAO-440]